MDSVLGPLLFLVFINDIIDSINVNARLFTDCILYTEIKTRDDQVKLNNCLWGVEE